MAEVLDLTASNNTASLDTFTKIYNAEIHMTKSLPEYSEPFCLDYVFHYSTE
ncbi:hypothetical protein APHWI1_1339 [Anaplasma phagocytophilum str. ApWI1]|uniref:Uncharacterized protein n=1 Tax=Anaplasma phagocytophilum str. ApWI1 TaxID=1359155 RepID=A0A0F3PY01_ANAPH|nr:hypothetical protein APHWEB_0180 [Anaplasma phagocytophilum str. Webster]KJV82564.1 hypothetical protein APHHGE2_0561 [Anaplasma phagocytophilum str. HGE2]KJV85260.1 hypothetical protein APHWI1_1339 [Anaplasma phagocytophilum str. ApWI1]KJV88167.1 hypothetical protein APHNYW_0289 [Anaplasma phagocytophilum str. ApNYW]